jgi:hypothetical protein
MEANKMKRTTQNDIKPRFPERDLNPVDLQHNRTNWMANRLIMLINDDLKTSDRNYVPGLRRALELVFDADGVELN